MLQAKQVLPLEKRVLELEADMLRAIDMLNIYDEELAFQMDSLTAQIQQLKLYIYKLEIDLARAQVNQPTNRE